MILCVASTSCGVRFWDGAWPGLLRCILNANSVALFKKKPEAFRNPKKQGEDCLLAYGAVRNTLIMLFGFRFEIESQLRSSSQPGTHPVPLASLKFSEILPLLRACLETAVWVTSPAQVSVWNQKFVVLCFSSHEKNRHQSNTPPPLRNKQARTVGPTQPGRSLLDFPWP